MPYPLRTPRTSEHIRQLTPWVPREHRLTPREFQGLGEKREVGESPELRQHEQLIKEAESTGMPYDVLRDIERSSPEWLAKERERMSAMPEKEFEWVYGETVTPELPPGQALDARAVTPGVYDVLQHAGAPGTRPRGMMEGLEFSGYQGPMQWSPEEGRRATQPVRNIPPPKSIYGR